MKQFIFIIGIFLTFSVAQSAEKKSICGVDDRVPSRDMKVARLVKSQGSGGCTATMIGRTCAITAGHCKSVMVLAEFNTPMSQNGKAQGSQPEDTYEIDQSSIFYKNGGMGQDYAVFKVRPNSITGQYPGDVQGHYNVSFAIPKEGDILRITGHGVDYSDPDRHLAQQTHTGTMSRKSRWGSQSTLNYRVDTMGGNSGSSVIMEATNEIIGIHTHGGCSTSSSDTSSANAGTSIGAIKVLRDAIEQCLRDEANLP